MKTRLLAIAIAGTLIAQSPLGAHCQMPCGIYHDDMVYEMIDQYLETMYKAVTELNHINLNGTVKDKNQYIRWVVLKEKESDNASNLITEYFLQQKIKPGEEDTADKVVSAHKLLFQIVRIKQNADIECIKSFAEEWGKFKLLFHIKGYECEMEKRRMSQWEKVRHRAEQKEENKENQADASTLVH